jgi:hypothetical protein
MRSVDKTGGVRGKCGTTRHAAVPDLERTPTLSLQDPILSEQFVFAVKPMGYRACGLHAWSDVYA